MKIEKLGPCPICNRLVNLFDGLIESHTISISAIDLCDGSGKNPEKVAKK